MLVIVNFGPSLYTLDLQPTDSSNGRERRTLPRLIYPWGRPRWLLTTIPQELGQLSDFTAPCPAWRWVRRGDGRNLAPRSKLLPGRLWLILDHFFLLEGPVQRDGLERPVGQKVRESVRTFISIW